MRRISGKVWGHLLVINGGRTTRLRTDFIYCKVLGLLQKPSSSKISDLKSKKKKKNKEIPSRKALEFLFSSGRCWYETIVTKLATVPVLCRRGKFIPKLDDVSASFSWFWIGPMHGIFFKCIVKQWASKFTLVFLCIVTGHSFNLNVDATCFQNSICLCT